MLAIDPEDLQAHYNLMLSYQGVGDSEMAKRHEALYRRFKADESAQEITGPYRQLHPDDNNERQAVHEHGSALGAGSAYALPASPDRTWAGDETRGGSSPSSSRRRPRSPSSRVTPSAQSGGEIQFADGTAYAGIAFRHNSGAFGKKYLPETMGSGLALFDYDNDGWLDVFFANEHELAGPARARRPPPPSTATTATAPSPT